MSTDSCRVVVEVVIDHGCHALLNGYCYREKVMCCAVVVDCRLSSCVSFPMSAIELQRLPSSSTTDTLIWKRMAATNKASPLCSSFSDATMMALVVDTGCICMASSSAAPSHPTSSYVTTTFTITSARRIIQEISHIFRHVYPSDQHTPRFWISDSFSTQEVTWFMQHNGSP
ncbi:predicted protein [Lichtheimia corymbifera JMRC:FSU:9682]|uniref:Uncharacterized protein n=1 Tax=Lichtheimia corymbifera JMRC:FSU:9682 TaxID=1263082 RepID=A0A068SG48_9FUNG|nr:predicted protein [Lichtheimia corymbifera JMRC:FSU:9682]